MNHHPEHGQPLPSAHPQLLRPVLATPKTAVTDIKPTIATLLTEQGPVTSGSKTSDTLPNLIGSGLPAHIKVAVYNYDTLIGHTQTNGEGTWQYKLEAPLGAGAHSLGIRVIDRDGSQSLKSDPFLLTVEPRAPIQPVIDGVYDNTGDQTGLLDNNAMTDESRPTLLGSKLPAGLRITIFDNGQVLGHEQTSSTGQWSFRPTTPLSSGKHIFTVQLHYPDGSTSTLSAPFNLQIEPQTTVKPVIESVLDAFGPEQGGIGPGGMTDDRQPTLIGGDLQTNQLVTVYLNNTVIGHVRTNDQGRWSFSPRTPLEFGEHQFKIRVNYPNGNLGPFSEEFTFTVIPATSLKPVIDGAYDSIGAQQGLLDSGDVTDDPRPALFGSGLTAHQWVHVYDNGRLLGSVQANALGRWNFKSNLELSDGPHLLTIRVDRPDGSLSPQSEPFELTVETGVSNRPVIEAVIDDVGSEQGAIINGGVTDDARPDIFGRSPYPDQLVIILDNNRAIGQVRSDTNGHWRYEPSAPLDLGHHRITVQVINANGLPSEASEPFLITVIAPTSLNRPAIQGIYDDVGSETGLVANGGNTDDTRAVISGAGLDPHLLVTIFDNGREIGRTYTNAQGQWNFKPSSLSLGAHQITVQTTHPDGNKSEWSDPYMINVIPHDLAILQIDGVHDRVGLERGLVAPGGKTDDAYALVSGSGAKPYQEIVIYAYGQVEPIGRARSNALGKWLFEPSGPWCQDTTSLTARAVLPDGSLGPHSQTYVFDFQPVSIRPIIGGLHDQAGVIQGLVERGGFTDDTRPSLFGKVDPESARSVTLFLDGRSFATITPDALGNWLYTPSSSLSLGHHQFTVMVTHKNGFQSGHSEPFAFNIERATSNTPTSITTSPGMKPVIDDVFDTVGHDRGPIAQGGVTDDARPVLSGSGLHPLMGNVLIFDNGRHIGTANINVLGNWTFKPSYNLALGAHELVIQVNYRNGTKSLQSDPLSLTVESAKPKIDGVHDDIGPSQGNVAPGGMTDDSRPTLSGGGVLANQLLRVYDGNQWIGEVRADALGNWVFETPVTLSLGKHSFAIQTMQSNGYWDQKSQTYEITVVPQSSSKTMNYQLAQSSDDLILMADEGNALPASPPNATPLTLANVLAAPAGDVLFAEPRIAHASELRGLTVADMGDWNKPIAPSSEGPAADLAHTPFSLELLQMDAYAA